jgi:hypothetical protein
MELPINSRANGNRHIGIGHFLGIERTAGHLVGFSAAMCQESADGIRGLEFNLVKRQNLFAIDCQSRSQSAVKLQICTTMTT